MSDLMREEFEIAFVARCKKKGEVARLYRFDDGRYEYLDASDAWWGWQASRECLVIELPKPCAWDNDGGFDRESDPDSECSMALIPKIDVMQSIHAAGVKTK